MRMYTFFFAPIQNRNTYMRIKYYYLLPPAGAHERARRDRGTRVPLLYTFHGLMAILWIAVGQLSCGFIMFVTMHKCWYPQHI